MIDWNKVSGFEWDKENLNKNADKHSVNQFESEQIFFNQPLLILADDKHSQKESRYHALGKTNDGRLLHITFTLRLDETLIRVISARDMTVTRELLMKTTKKLPAFKNEAEEKAFWEVNDSSDYLDWKQAESVSLPNLKPSTKTISLRLSEGLLNSIKIEANKRDMPYQSLIKAWLANDVKQSRDT